VDDARASAERGFTLIEIAVAVAIVATTVAAGVGISLASRSFAVSTAAAEFDHMLDGARTVARETQGATLVFSPDAYGDGTEVRILTSGPNDTLVATTFPVMHTHAVIEEQQSLGKAPFAFVVHASGALGGRPGYRLGDTTASAEVGCPASGSFHFAIHTAGTTADRFIPCRISLAASGPAALAPWPPAPIAPAPTPCTTGPCAPSSLPTPPSSTGTCPPNYSATPGGCAPPPPASGPRYHVSASPASPTMTVGGPDDAITATADLTNPATVPAGTPLSLPVLIQNATAPACTTTPPGPQPSGSTFTVKAITAGSCTITIAADPTGVPNATSDTATLTISVSDPAIPIRPPQSCDLTQNGKCYHRIVPSMTKIFRKMDIPDTACGDREDGPTCWYIDSIKNVSLLDAYSFLPPVPPTSQAQELLFQVEQVDGLTYGCEPYSAFERVPATDPIQWPSTGIGAPVDSPPGFGDPSTFVRENIVYSVSPPADVLDETVNTRKVTATLLDLISAIAFQKSGNEFTFTYSSADAQDNSYITWLPDFPGCDAFGDLNNAPIQYGLVSPLLRFTIYQAGVP
jgi:prepilin-type N-terminal cleavage/methylation domain-containing protein